MADQLIWRYELGYSHDALKAKTNDVGQYTNVGWLPINSFGTRWGKYFLLTSPFIERISARNRLKQCRRHIDDMIARHRFYQKRSMAMKMYDALHSRSEPMDRRESS
jgi:hypothetical protein